LNGYGVEYMKVLTAYYSRSGNTERVAEKIATKMGADIDRIVDRKDRDRTFNGWLIAGKDASQKVETDIVHDKDPEDYDLVIVGTPVWAWTMSPAVRTYLSQHKFKRVAFFCTYGALKGKTYTHMEELSKRPLGTLGMSAKKIDNVSTEKTIGEFCSSLENELIETEDPRF
jgi:flavodoxin